ncbi:hypothetical protein [Yersinia sp. Marseille-Q3913]|uniref:hypothetical protein n=1 Tax=Yersinia sp. Marseille-Q3913 TaxID=2830769 RepID=UPI001BAFE9CA|nr:hypothetical protein [Yersinia sp. Marseille-Q3913]MBS0056194.1 hypothetical protein [Yersinia sp. Marseille-Q3913]
MNINNKHLFMGLLLLILSPAVMATPDFRDVFVKDYTNCSIQLLDDDSVKVSFRANVLGNSTEDLDVYPLLSFYLYDEADALSSQSSHPANISNLSINGNGIVSPLTNNEWVLNSKTITGTAFYDVSFVVPSDTIHHLGAVRVGVTIGLVEYITRIKGDGYVRVFVVQPKGVSFNSLGNQCRSFVIDSPPEALKIDPKFRLKSAVWELKSIDLDTLLNNGSLEVPLKNPHTDELCISYRSMGISDDGYMISINNINGLSEDGQHFKLIEKSSNNVINYDIYLSYDGAFTNEIDYTQANNPSQHIHLERERFPKGEACWSPEIEVYSTGTTDKGSYSDTLNFTITPVT